MLFHPLWNYLLVTKEQANLGIVGTGIAGIITDSLVFGSLLLYTNRIERIKDGVFWPDKRAYTDLGYFMRLGTQTFIMRALDYWAGNLVIIATGYLSVVEQAFIHDLSPANDCNCNGWRRSHVSIQYSCR